MLRMCNHLSVAKMKGVIIVVVALGVISGALTKAQKEMIKHTPVAQSLSPENIEALRAFKQLGFDDQHAPGRIRQSDIAVHHVYHDRFATAHSHKMDRQRRTDCTKSNDATHYDSAMRETLT